MLVEKFLRTDTDKDVADAIIGNLNYIDKNQVYVDFVRRPESGGEIMQVHLISGKCTFIATFGLYIRHPARDREQYRHSLSLSPVLCISPGHLTGSVNLEFSKTSSGNCLP